MKIIDIFQNPLSTMEGRLGLGLGAVIDIIAHPFVLGWVGISDDLYVMGSGVVVGACLAAGALIGQAIHRSKHSDQRQDTMSAAEQAAEEKSSK